MFTDVVLPNLGFGMEEGRLVSWLKQPGQTVRKGEPIAEIESDKATVELEAVVDGVLVEVLFPADSVVPVGAALARIRTGSDTSVPATKPTAPVPQTPPPSAAPTAVATQTTISPVARRLAEEHQLNLAAVPGSGPGGRITREDVQAVIDRAAVPAGKVLAAPAVRKAARDAGIDLRVVSGTGPEGRVTRADLHAYMQHIGILAGAPEDTMMFTVEQPDVVRGRYTIPAPDLAPEDSLHEERRSTGERPASPVAFEDVLPFEASGAPENNVPAEGPREIPMSRMRQAIARGLTRSMQEAPHFYVTAELDFTSALRALPSGVGVNNLILYLTVQTLLALPEMNATYQNDKLYQHQNVNLAVAVALPAGLLTPVLHHAEDFSLSGLAGRARDLISRARDNKLKPDELTGGTFTVSNLGIIPQVERFTAILNPPQVGILAVGAAKERPVVINGGLHIRTTAYLTLSADHRVIDGLIAARFLQMFDEKLQQFQ